MNLRVPDVVANAAAAGGAGGWLRDLPGLIAELEAEAPLGLVACAVMGPAILSGASSVVSRYWPVIDASATGLRAGDERAHSTSLDSPPMHGQVDATGQWAIANDATVPTHRRRNQARVSTEGRRCQLTRSDSGADHDDPCRREDDDLQDKSI
jgi:hypothetical protein